MSNNPLISVIIPIYKVEKYLDKCVESVVNQTYKDLEILLVDDGSPDGCPAMCDAWAAKDRRIKVIHKANGGLSDARNRGVDECEGEYITFIDSDDYVTADYVQKLYCALIENDADVSMCNFGKVDEQYRPIPENPVNKLKNDVCTGRDVLDRYFVFNGTATALVIACGKLFRKALFNNLWFEKGRLNEDEYLFFPLYRQVNTVAMIEDKMYCYLQREGSIIHSSVSEKKAKDICDFWQARLQQLDCGSALYKKTAIGCCLGIFAFIDKMDRELPLIKEMEATYKRYIRKYVFDPCIDLPPVHKLLYFVFSLSPRVFAGMVHR